MTVAGGTYIIEKNGNSVKNQVQVGLLTIWIAISFTMTLLYYNYDSLQVVELQRDIEITKLETARKRFVSRFRPLFAF